MYVRQEGKFNFVDPRVPGTKKSHKSPGSTSTNKWGLEE